MIDTRFGALSCQSLSGRFKNYYPHFMGAEPEKGNGLLKVTPWIGTRARNKPRTIVLQSLDTLLSQEVNGKWNYQLVWGAGENG